MTDKETEILNILQEECAEVVQAVSKCNRFGLDRNKPGKHTTNRQHHAEELGDLQAMIKLVQDANIVSETDVKLASNAKIEKLKIWSTIYRV